MPEFDQLMRDAAGYVDQADRFNDLESKSAALNDAVRALLGAVETLARHTNVPRDAPDTRDAESG